MSLFDFSDFSPDNQTANAFDTVGIQSDGTFSTPVTAQVPNPQDAGGGSLGQYAPQLLDIFKFGVGTWAQANSQSNLLDYKRWEATNGGLYQQGNAAGVRIGANGATVGISPGMLMLMAGALALVLITGKH